MATFIRFRPNAVVSVKYERADPSPLARLLGKKHKLFRETHTYHFKDGNLRYESTIDKPHLE